MPILCVVLIREYGTWRSLVSHILRLKHLRYNHATSCPHAPVGEKEDNGDIPPAFHEDMTLREMKASFKSNKGDLTRLSNQINVVAIKSPGSATQLNESYKFLAKCDLSLIHI